MDLAYIPNHCSAKNVDQEFFKRVRSAYYVVSGNDAASGEPSRSVLDALLDGKAQWGSNLQVKHLRVKTQAPFTPQCFTFHPEMQKKVMKKIFTYTKMLRD